MEDTKYLASLVKIMVKEVMKNLKTVQKKQQGIDHTYIWYVEVGSNDHKDLNYSSKDKVKQKENNSTYSMAMEKLVKINGKCAEASIKVSSSINIMKDGKHRCTIQFVFKETIFVISDKNDVDKDHPMKRENNDKKKTDSTNCTGRKNQLLKVVKVEMEKYEVFKYHQKFVEIGQVDMANNYGYYYNSGNGTEDDEIEFDYNGAKLQIVEQDNNENLKTVEFNKMDSYEASY
ncbi:3553_t:CDS:2 [Gigaspora margarita]|uniref:3553_t:CDS:1 n=1 Tax=Gigaspora margarita TaxID=4874 RepID=A0ABN7WAI0_GIGMA|nr:3553_t:CDS:2 [Gigaspora margarita]